MLSARTLSFSLCFFAIFCHVYSMEEPVITRGDYDLLHYPKCNGKKLEDFDCGEIYAERFGENKTCQCRCKDGYVVYRDPLVNSRYEYLVGERGCVWYGYYREGCHFLRRDDELVFGDQSFHAPIILDFTKAGSTTLNKQDSFVDSGSYCFDPYVRIPGQNRWERVQNVVFGLISLDPPENSRYELSWSFTGSYDIYAYQGLIMKLNFTECQQPRVYCMMAKLAGTYTGTTHCKQRTVNGRCCIFPFVHNGEVHKKCASTPDMPGGTWCAVSLNKSVENGNHKWREYCSTSSSTSSSQTSRPFSRSPPVIHTPPASSAKKKNTPQKRTTEPHSRGTPKSSRDKVDNHPVVVVPVTITVTHNACNKSMKTTAIFGDKSTGGESNPNVRFIVGVVLGILLFLVVVTLLGCYLRRRKSAKGKSRARKTISKEDLAESSYASFYSNSTPRNTRNQLNHGYQQSIELTDDQAAVVRRSYLRDSLNSSRGSHFYDTIESKRGPNIGLSSPIYSMPESDYSLIMEERQTKIDNAMPPVLPVMLSGSRPNPSKHLYSVLERDNDPLKHPEPIDNDTVFVEANPIYGTNTQYNVKKPNADEEFAGGVAEANPLYGTTTGFNRKLPPPLPPRLYDDPMDILPTKFDRPGKGERDV